VLFGFWTLVAVALVAAAAVLCAKYRAYLPYVAFVFALWLAGVLACCASRAPDDSLLRTAASSALAITPVAVLYCLIPGFQVRGGASHVRVVVSTAIASGLAFPLWQLWCWYVECKLFYTCLGGLRVAAV